MGDVRGRYVLGVDPGFQGALAIYDPDGGGIISCIDMPLQKLGKDERKLIDATAMADWVGLYAPGVRVALVEDVCAHPGQNVSAMFRFGFGAGIIQGILAAHKVPIRMLTPVVWKTVLNLGHDKAKSIALAKKLFPNDVSLFAKPKDDGRAEAALLAYLGGMLMKSGHA